MNSLFFNKQLILCHRTLFCVRWVVSFECWCKYVLELAELFQRYTDNVKCWVYNEQ